MSSIVCDRCGEAATYDEKNTIYLKCPHCGRVLIDRKQEYDDDDPLIVVDYGIDGDLMWVETQDSKGNTYTYYKEWVS